MSQLAERYRSFLRPCRKVTDMFPLAFLVTFLILMFGSLIGMFIVRTVGLPTEIPEEQLTQIAEGTLSVRDVTGVPEYLSCAGLYLNFIGIWIAYPLAMLIPPSNRRMLKKLLFIHDGRSFKLTMFGALLGFGINSISVVASMLLGDVALHFARFEPGPLLLLLFAVFVQSGAEEISCRLFLYQKLARRYRHPAVAAVLSAVFFAACHVFNPGITVVGVAQIVIIGLLFSVLVYYYDALGACIAMHTAWNYTQNIIWGLPNSGVVSLYSMFELDAASSGFFFDPVFGVEGAVGSVLLLTIALIALLVYAKRRGLKPHDLWADAEAAADGGTQGGGSQQPRHMSRA